jgi:protease-4
MSWDEPIILVDTEKGILLFFPFSQGFGTMMRQSILPLVMLVIFTGCNHPLRTITSGSLFTETRVTSENHVVSENEVVLHTPPVQNAGPLLEMPVMGEPHANKRIAMIDVDGLLLNEERVGVYSLGQNPVAVFREKLDYIAQHSEFCGVVLRIHSPGGGVTATDIMARDLEAFKKRTGLPVVACLMDVSAGGAFYLALGADQIVAHPTTITGGVGVILNLYNLQDALAQFNVVPLTIKAGENIDTGTPVKPLPENAELRLQQIADQFHARFIARVHQSRPLTAGLDQQNFDGRIFTAMEAKSLGLIDQIGYLDDAVALASGTGSSTGVSAVMLHRRNDWARSPYDISPNTPIQRTLFPIDVPGLNRSRLPTFMYLWQPDPNLPVTHKP